MTPGWEFFSNIPSGVEQLDNVDGYCLSMILSYVKYLDFDSISVREAVGTWVDERLNAFNLCQSIVPIDLFWRLPDDDTLFISRARVLRAS